MNCTINDDRLFYLKDLSDTYGVEVNINLTKQIITMGPTSYDYSHTSFSEGLMNSYVWFLRFFILQELQKKISLL